MGAETFRSYALSNYGIELSLSKANQYREAWRRTYPGVRRWQLRQTANADRIGYAETRLGRRLEKLWAPDRFYTRSLSHPVQGSCAEALMIAMTLLSPRLGPYKAEIVAVVHDEIVVESPMSCASEVTKLVEQAMAEAFCKVFPESAPHGLAEAQTGASW